MVELVQVDVVRAEPAEGSLDGVENVLAAGTSLKLARAHDAEELRRNDEVVTPAAEPSPDDLLRVASTLRPTTVWVAVRCVEKRHPALRRAVGMANDCCPSHCAPKVIVPRQ